MCLQLHYSESAIAFSLQQCAQVWEYYILSLLYCDHSWIFSAFLFSNDLQLLHRVLLESVMTSNMSRPDRLSMLQNWNKFNNSETRQLSMLHNWHKFNNSEYLNLTEDSDTSGKVGCNTISNIRRWTNSSLKIKKWMKNCLLERTTKARDNVLEIHCSNLHAETIHVLKWYFHYQTKTTIFYS